MNDPAPVSTDYPLMCRGCESKIPFHLRNKKTVAKRSHDVSRAASQTPAAPWRLASLAKNFGRLGTATRRRCPSVGLFREGRANPDLSCDLEERRDSAAALLDQLSKHGAADEPDEEIAGEIGSAGDAAVFMRGLSDEAGRGRLGSFYRAARDPSQ